MKRELIMVLLLILVVPLVFAQDCPFDNAGCEYPGECGIYVDDNNDYICDNSQIIPQNIVDLDLEQARIGKEIYNFIPVLIILFILYFLTYFLSKIRIIKLITHRKLWNFLLLITFLITGILGLLLVIRINYGWNIISRFNMKYWHVEAGISMAIISFFHILWHWSYFKSYLKFKKQSL